MPTAAPGAEEAGSSFSPSSQQLLGLSFSLNRDLQRGEEKGGLFRKGMR